MEKLKHPEAPGQKNKITGSQQDTLQVVYYTDPLCCWSWAFETVWQQFKTAYGKQLTIRYCMGGLLQQWQGYHDALLSVSRPAQMGPIWMQVNHTTGVPLDSTIWFRDPPASSYPACLAVKCAGLQSAAMEEQYLYLARKAVMTQQKNIARKEVLLELGAILEETAKGA
jgi:protein-disulfide isomerase-like protein with CxxC motif